MLKIRTTLALAVPACTALIATAIFLAPAKATQEQISLMQTIEVWKYPGSTLQGGASMSDGGNPAVPDMSCRAVLTTKDPVEDVARFYAEKFPAKSDEARAVVSQDDSKDRPLALRVILVHRADTSNTIVISRGLGEKETHIAWTQYRRFPEGH